MVKMSEESIEFLKTNMPEFSKAKCPNDILSPLYDLIMNKGFISHEEGYNSFGESAQAVYDDIFDNNIVD